MLNLKQAMEDLNVTNGEIGEVVGISRTAVTNITNHDLWPRSKNVEETKKQIRTLMEKKGASAATLAVLFDKYTASNDDALPNEDINMLLRKQPLYPKTRKHFMLFNDPFGELNDADQVFDTTDVKYVRLSMEQTLTSERFLAVVGESGAGKSTLRRDLVEKINRSGQDVIVIEPYVLGLEDNDKKGKTLKALDIAGAIIRAIDPLLPMHSASEARYEQLHTVLRDSRRAGYRHILMIEEAHGLSIPTLKHLKRFFELEDGFNRLLSIILIGQTELAKKLADKNPNVREVVQRIEMITLEPLNNDLEAYVEHRLKLAGKSMDEVFDKGALDALRAKLTIPSRQKGAAPVSLLYPLAVGNQITAAMNMAAEIGVPKITADVIKAV